MYMVLNLLDANGNEFDIGEVRCKS